MTAYSGLTRYASLCDLRVVVQAAYMAACMATTPSFPGCYAWCCGASVLSLQQRLTFTVQVFYAVLLAVLR